MKGEHNMSNSAVNIMEQHNKPVRLRRAKHNHDSDKKEKLSKPNNTFF